MSSQLSMAVNIVDLTTKLAFSGTTTRTHTGDACKSNVVTVGLEQTEIDLSADGNGGVIVLRNNTPDSLQKMRVLFGLWKGKMVASLKAYDMAVLPLLPESNKFYLLAYDSENSAIGPDVTADAGTDVITFASAHGLDVGDKVQFYTEGTLPGGLVEGTQYEVKTVESTTEITLVDGAGTLNITDAGTGTHHSIIGLTSTRTAMVSYLYHNE